MAMSPRLTPTGRRRSCSLRPSNRWRGAEPRPFALLFAKAIGFRLEEIMLKMTGRILVLGVVLSGLSVPVLAQDTSEIEADSASLQAALTELNSLGLRVEVHAGGAAVAASAAGGAAPATAAIGGLPQESFVDRLRAFFAPWVQRHVDRMRDEVVEGIMHACVINITAAGEGFALASVSITLGGTVTATFTPTPEFCASAG